MKGSLLFLALVVFVSLSHAQAPAIEWQKSYGGTLEDFTRSIILTGDGGFIICASTESNDGDVSGNHGDADFWLMKADGSGNIQWQKCLGGSGDGKFYPDAERYFGTSERGESAVPKLHFPGLDPEAASWLLKNRRIKAIGLDTPSIDYGQSKDFRSHQVLLGANIPVFENVANLDMLPFSGAWVIALPMKIANGSGAPLRIVAWVPVK